MRNWRTRSVVAAAAIVVAVVSACGSTVRLADGSAGAPGDGGLGSQQPGGTPGNVDGGPSAGGAGIGGEQPAGGGSDARGGTGIQGPATGGTSGGSASSAGGLAVSGRGYTAKEIFLGFSYNEGAQDFADSFGLKNFTIADAKSVVHAVLDHVNKQGGVQGRKLVPVWHVSRTGTPLDVEYQARCSTWTEDHKVVLGMNGAGQSVAETLVACMAKHDTPVLGTTSDPGTTKTFARFAPYLYAPQVPSSTGIAASKVDSLFAANYFSAWTASATIPRGTRVGVVYLDLPTFREVKDTVVKPRLAARGIKVAVERSIEYAASQEQVSGTLAQIKSAALAMRSENVTHVLLLDAFGHFTIWFTAAAEDQQYRPRYGLSTGSAPGLLEPNVPAAQLRGALGTGYIQPMDVSAANDPPNLPGEKLCHQILTKAGVAYKSSRTAEASAMMPCGNILWAWQVLRAAPNFGTAGIRAAVDALGNRFSPAVGFGDIYGRGVWAGAAATRPLGYVDACSCFRYVLPTRPLPR